ncbi:MAG: ABC transporter substrate-binding protein [Alphaproteobacteria bacterium]|nr:ABC transporter substrate-binding protein [Alphaproteobacteria bacterium]
MKKFTIAVIAAVLVAAAGAAAPAKDWKKVRIGTEGAYPPFNYIDSEGTLKGFEIDLARALCEKIGAECEFVVQDWDGIIPGLMAKKYDVIIASLYITDERREKFDFTQKYYQTPGRFVVRKGTRLEISDAGLKGKVVGVQRATAFERFLRDTYPALELKVYATQDEVNLDLMSGRLDAAMADVVALSQSFLNTPEGKDFEFTGPSFSGSKWFGFGAGVAVRKEDPDLRDAFDKAIEAVRADGTYEKIRAAHFAFDIYGE